MPLGKICLSTGNSFLAFFEILLFLQILNLRKIDQEGRGKHCNSPARAAVNPEIPASEEPTAMAQSKGRALGCTVRGEGHLRPVLLIGDSV